jgi:hypothetical protein
VVHFFHEAIWNGVPYYGRMIQGRMADALAAKPYERHATHTSRNRHLRERGIAAPVEACPENEEAHRVISDLPSPLPLVTPPNDIHSQSNVWL